MYVIVFYLLRYMFYYVWFSFLIESVSFYLNVSNWKVYVEG